MITESSFVSDGTLAGALVVGALSSSEGIVDIRFKLRCVVSGVVVDVERVQVEDICVCLRDFSISDIPSIIKITACLSMNPKANFQNGWTLKAKQTRKRKQNTGAKAKPKKPKKAKNTGSKKKKRKQGS